MLVFKNWGVTYDGIYVYNAACSGFICTVWANEYVSFQQIIGGIIIFVGLWFVKSEKVKVHSIAGEPISK